LRKGVEGIIFIYGGSFKIKFLKNYATWLWFFSIADLYYDDVMYPHFVKYILGWLDGTRKERLQLAEYVGLIPRIIRREYGKIKPDHPLTNAIGRLGD
jgi:hypothetical protein